MRGVIYYLFDYIRGEGSLMLLVSSLFSILAVILVCTPVHECAHALVARILGDRTAEDHGRLTLNPAAHIDPLGTLCMLVGCIGWAKPVPVNLYKCRKVSMRTADKLVSIAGPLSNVLLGLIFVIIAKVLTVTMEASETLYYVIWAMDEIALINAYLAVFNLIPVPPFDGYSLIVDFLPRKVAMWVEDNDRILRVAVFLLVVSSVLSRPLGFLAGKLYDFFDLITGFIY